MSRYPPTPAPLWRLLYITIAVTATQIPQVPPTIIISNSAPCKLKTTNGVDLSEGLAPSKSLSLSFAPSTSTLRAYMIFIDFDDASAASGGDTATTRELYDYLIPDAADWYASSSFGKLTLEVSADFSRVYRMPRRSDSYRFVRRISRADHCRYIMDALAAVGSRISFAGTNVLYIVPTRNAVNIPFSPIYMDAVTAGDGTEVGHSVTFGMDLYDKWGYKVPNHKTGHAMGLPDLYSYSGGSITRWVGGYDLMGLISGGSPDFLAWHKWKLGWFSDDQFDCVDKYSSTTTTTIHTIAPVELDAGIKGMVVRVNETTAVVAEVRSKNGLNRNAFETGVLIYTLDISIGSGYGCIVVQGANPGSDDGCNFGEPNHAPFTHDGNNTFTSEEMGVTVTVIGQDGDKHTIEVEVEVD
ncbi:MAG: hypothetical protein M1834_008761 [Cirrosporium novae-zelandiae]|nr:MAG: hypothetical protein M1834_008761 [Cirrosporium novae-zelandiae]